LKNILGILLLVLIDDDEIDDNGDDDEKSVSLCLFMFHRGLNSFK